MKQFNLEEFKKDPNRKIVTRDGKPVRIICTDAKGDYPVVGLIYYHDKKEVPENYMKNGSCYIDDESNCDLFFTPEKREGYINLFKQNIGLNTGFVFNTKEEAEKSAKGLSCYITTIKIEWEE